MLPIRLNHYIIKPFAASDCNSTTIPSTNVDPDQEVRVPAYRAKCVERGATRGECASLCTIAYFIFGTRGDLLTPVCRNVLKVVTIYMTYFSLLNRYFLFV